VSYTKYTTLLDSLRITYNLCSSFRIVLSSPRTEVQTYMVHIYIYIQWVLYFQNLC